MAAGSGRAGADCVCGGMGGLDGKEGEMKVKAFAPRGQCLTKAVRRLELVAESENDYRFLLNVLKSFEGSVEVTFTHLDMVD
jgi:hypothetical protein